MSYKCSICDYLTNDSGNYSRHKKTKKHIELTSKKTTSMSKKIKVSSKIATDSMKLVDKANLDDSINSPLICPYCKISIKHKSSFSRHKKNCKDTDLVNELKLKLEISEKEKEILSRIEKEKTELLNNFMVNANNIINNAQNNTKTTTEAIKAVSISALKYANDKFKDAPALLPLENFNINNLSFDNENDKKQLIEILVYNAKQNSLDKLLGDHIVKEYKKDDPKDQSFHTTDCSRLNYIVRNLIENALSWSMDKSGIKICSSIVKPLIDKCINLLLVHQKYLIDNMEAGSFRNKETVQAIISVLMMIDRGSLEAGINKYIAPFFNLNKNN
jgi:hypothetical protein